LGGALAGFAVMTKTELLLLLIGGVYVVEAVSVILQVASFKYLGRRIFLMAPIHYHFEMKAWTETMIMLRFCFIAGILCALASRAVVRGGAVAGNVGRPRTAVDAPESAWLVCDLSSFQHEDDHQLALDIAELLNREP